MKDDLIKRNLAISYATSGLILRRVDGEDWIRISEVKQSLNDVPTVESRLIANVSFDEDKLKEIVQAEVIEKIKSGELVIKDERPQGKWIFHNDYNESCRYGCNQCGNLTNIGSNFCPNCGVRMNIDKLQHKCHTLSRNKTTCDVCGAKLE